MDLVARIKEILEEVPGTIDQKAKRIGTTSPTLYSYLRGRTAPSFDFLAKIKSVTGVNLNWLVSGEGEKFPLSGSDRTGALDIEFLEAIRCKLEDYLKESHPGFNKDRSFFEYGYPLVYEIYNTLVGVGTLETIDKDFEKVQPMVDYAITLLSLVHLYLNKTGDDSHMPQTPLRELCKRMKAADGHVKLDQIMDELVNQAKGSGKKIRCDDDPSSDPKSEK